MKPLPYRQIHLDYHTSPLLERVGEDFDERDFIQTLKQAHVNSINLFAKCHHGLYYYPTEIGGRVHPHLRFDLFGRQIAACREAGIRALAYTTVVWAEDTCDLHPDWMQISPDGVLGSKPPFSSPYNTLTNRGWRSLCMNQTEYRDYLKAELKEIYDRYRPDGYWIDIIWQFECVCPRCREDMKKLGLDPEDYMDRKRHDRMVEIDFMRDIYGFIHSLDDSLEVYFNGTPAEFDLDDCPALSTRRKRQCLDFVDIESLPSETWGYSHFPVLANYVNKYPGEFAMMNGRFHQTWADFGTLRNVAALEYECFRALSLGAAVCVGDQLHPLGGMDHTVYSRIGTVFASIEEKEPWCRGTRKLCDIGVVAPNRVMEAETEDGPASLKSKEGVWRMLTELHLPFDFLDLEDDFSPYQVLILPDQVTLAPKEAEKIRAYLKNGGKLLFSGCSGMDPEKTGFALEELGIKYLGKNPYAPAYFKISGEFPRIPPMTYHFAGESFLTEPLSPKAEALAPLVDPYFNRSWEHFCSHRQTPQSGRLSGPAAIQTGPHTMYLSMKLFEDYARSSLQVLKLLFRDCLSRLYPRPLVECDLPSTGELTLREKENSLVVHLLHYIPHRRCPSLDTIEDVIPLFQRTVRVRTERPPRQVRLVPQKEEISFRDEDGYVSFVVPEITGHQMVELVF